MKQRLKWDDYIGILLLAVSVILLGISVFLSFSSDIWYDELFTMGLGTRSLGELISVTARDVHPPLYYMIVKLFLGLSGMAGGSVDQVVAAKLVSVLPFFLCLVYAAVKIRKNFGLLPAGLFGFLLLTMPQMADYTVEVRMYGYAVFFITAGMLHAYELAGEKSTGKKSYVNWIALTLYSLAACYTHYFACVAACMIYLYLFLAFRKEGRVKEEIKKFLISGVLCAAGYLPWFVIVVTAQVSQVKTNYWILPLGIRTLGGCVKFIFKPFFSNELLNTVLAVLLFLVYGALLALLIIRQVKTGRCRERQKRQQAFFTEGCILVLAGIIFFGFAASFLIRPIFVYRYMMPAMGVFWLAFALLVSGQKSRKYLFFPVLLLLAVTGLRNYRAFYGEEMWKRVQMAEAKEGLSQIKEGDIVICNFDQTQAVVSYYLSNDTYLWYGEPEALIREMYPENHGLVEGEFSDEAGILNIKKLMSEGKKVWFLGSGNARDEIIEKWNPAGIEAEELGSVMVERYWFNIYALKEK